jgi:diguanylate cyclase (GGDEF)-like protein/PAS domain S-box-containing protein
MIRRWLSPRYVRDLSMEAFKNADRSKVMDLMVEVAAHSASCISGVLVGGRAGEWVALAGFGVDDFQVDAAAEDFLSTAIAHEDMFIINEVMGRTVPVSLQRLRHFTEDFLVAVAVRSEDKALLGVLLVSSPQQQLRLSAAQTYALKTHAVILGGMINVTKGGIPQGEAPSLERLRLLESVVVNAKDAVLITEAEPINAPGPRIVYCNPAFLATTGFEASEVIGMTPRILHCEETSRDSLDQIRASLQRWKPIEIEVVNARKDGSKFWVQLSIVPVANEKGWFTHWVSVQRDVSERKEAELLSRQARKDREERIALETRLLERQRIEHELSYAAYHDGLTSLYNRTYLMSHLLKLFGNNDDKAPAVTVLFLDLDRFKFVNDSLGHRAGDLLLTVVARRLEACLRAGDVLARIGGDEFAILLVGDRQASAAEDMAQRIVSELVMPVAIEGQDIFTSCSLGIVSADLGHASPEDLLRDADVAMYAAKKQGRGRWTVFDSSMRTAAVNALLMQNALKQALQRNEFSVVYQPIYDVPRGRVSGVEALVRWRHPELGHVPADVFIPIAEELGVIHELGRWVMERACIALLGWKEEFPGSTLHLNVNVSGTELNRSGYVSQVAGVLAKTGFAAGELQIEITESIFLLEPEATVKVLEELRDLGVRIALDDFGTGYSSLGYIDRYPIDAIKIDQSFVSRMMSLDRSDAIVRCILSLGKALHIAITAEGVETLAQLQLLREMNCPFVQGYLLSPPVRDDEVPTLLRAGVTSLRSSLTQRADER